MHSYGPEAGKLAEVDVLRCQNASTSVAVNHPGYPNDLTDEIDGIKFDELQAQPNTSMVTYFGSQRNSHRAPVSSTMSSCASDNNDRKSEPAV